MKSVACGETARRPCPCAGLATRCSRRVGRRIWQSRKSVNATFEVFAKSFLGRRSPALPVHCDRTSQMLSHQLPLTPDMARRGVARQKIWGLATGLLAAQRSRIGTLRDGSPAIQVSRITAHAPELATTIRITKHVATPYQCDQCREPGAPRSAQTARADRPTSRVGGVQENEIARGFWAKALTYAQNKSANAEKLGGKHGHSGGESGQQQQLKNRTFRSRDQGSRLVRTTIGSSQGQSDR